MKDAWRSCKKLLCIRTDNMGDIMMSGPAIRALKESIGCSITLLVSKQGAPICSSVPGIDNFIVSDIPWSKSSPMELNGSVEALAKELKKHTFDGAVIFTVYSQSALPAALCVFMAGI